MSSARGIKATARRGCHSRRDCGTMCGRGAIFVGRRRAAIGLTGVALCHDILVARTLARTRRWLGLAFLTAMLAAHVGLAFEIVFTGHAGSMRWPGIGSQLRRLFSPVSEFIESLPFAVHDRWCAPVPSSDGRIWPDAETARCLDHSDLRAACGRRMGPARATQPCVRPASALPQPDGCGAVAHAIDTISASIDPNWNLVQRRGSRYPPLQNDNAVPAQGGAPC